MVGLELMSQKHQQNVPFARNIPLPTGNELEILRSNHSSDCEAESYRTMVSK